MNKNYTFKSSVFSGDLIYMLSGIKHTCEAAETKADIYLWLDRPMKSYDGAVHPYGMSGINRYALDMLRPLLESQTYIASCQEWRGEPISVDLDELRTKQIAPMPYGSISRWAGYAWPDMQCDLAQAWIYDFKPAPLSLGVGYPPMLVLNQRKASPAYGKIIINRTSRYQNPMIHYWFLKDYAKDLIFTGLPEEHAEFCRQWELDIPLLKVNDFLELAVTMASCRYFIGNQSMCFALAEAMKIPRVLEVCPYAPNVIPCGKHGYDFMHQFALEWLVKDKSSPLNKL